MNDQITPSETAKLLELAQSCLNTPGDFIELGCYKGDTTVLLGKLLTGAGGVAVSAAKTDNRAGAGPNLAEPIEESATVFAEDMARQVPPQSAKLAKRLFAFDSFSGLPAKSSVDSSGAGANFRAGELAVSKREVIEKLKKHQLRNVIVKKAWFSDLTPADLPDEIAFAFIDGDFYESQTQGLKLAMPKLTKQGVIVCHDYHNPELPGATRAVDEFLHSHTCFSLQVFQSLAILRAAKSQ